MKSLIARWIRSEFCLWSCVLAVTALYANWLWHYDTRTAQRALAGWANRVSACLPFRDSSRKAAHNTTAQQTAAAKSLARSRLLELPTGDAGGSTDGRQPRIDQTGFAVAVNASEAVGSEPRRDSPVSPTAVSNPVDHVRATPTSQPDSRKRIDADAAAVAFEDGLRRFQRYEYGLAAQEFEIAATGLPRDARPRYFLAISRYFAGERAAADHSLSEATRVESSYPAPDLGRLLERVQGPVRIWLEDARRKERVGPYGE